MFQLKTTRPILRWITLSLCVMGPSVSYACSIFPEAYRAPHEQLIGRTANIALVRTMKIEREYPVHQEKVVFRIEKILKGEFGNSVELMHTRWRGNVPKDALSDFNQHRNSEFWPESTSRKIALNRSLGVGTDCKIDYYFVLGETYLGFFGGGEPQHIHSFELISSSDDRWLNWVVDQLNQ